MSSYQLAFVIERYFEFGGLQRDMRRFAAACAQRGHDVTVFAGRWDGPRDTALKIEIVDFKSLTNHGTVRSIEDFVHGLKARGGFDCIVGFKRISGLDVYFAGDVCLKAKLQRQNRYWLRFLPRYRSYLKQEAAVFGPSGDAELLVISPEEAQIIQRIYKTTPERIHLLPPGIDRQRLTSHSLSDDGRKQFRRQFRVLDNDLMILTVGSSFHTKGIDRVIWALAALPEHLRNRCSYVVAGLGHVKHFQAIARRAGIGERVFFTGGRSDIADFYHSADVLIHPARTETTGASLLEAMITGVPVITTKNCGYSHYIQQANAGTVCQEPFSQAHFNQVVLQVLSDDPQRLQFGRNGYRYGQTADLYSMIETGVQVIIDRAEKNRGRQ